MNNFEQKEKNLNKLIEELGSLAAGYSHTSLDINKILSEKNQLNLEKKAIEKKKSRIRSGAKIFKTKVKRVTIRGK